MARDEASSSGSPAKGTGPGQPGDHWPLHPAVAESSAAMRADRARAVQAVERAIATLAQPEVPLDAALRGELIAKLSELLARLGQLHAVLPQGEGHARRPSNTPP